MKNLRGKTVLITGGAAGIGLATAHRFGKAGSRLILTDINDDTLNSARHALEAEGYEVQTYVNDVTDKKAVFALAEDVLTKYERLDVLINNAGIGHHGEVKDTTLEQWEKLININLFGPLHFIYAFLPSMTEKQHGHIVNLSSGQAFYMLPTWGVYASIKLALGGLSEVMHYELSKYNVKVTVVYPFMVNTGFYDDVEAETFGSKLSMKLLPYYSNAPETVAKRIFKTVKKGKAVEMVNFLNDFGFYSRFFKPVHAGMSIVSNWFLSKKD